MENSSRPFSAGSRPAPDPYDQYLEREGFYRKHTARDPSCLFRVVSEQVFDVQVYHEKVRQDCVRFMRQKRTMFEMKIHGSYDDYLNEMSKSFSYGSFLELEALAHVYRRNVFLFEPYNRGAWFLKCDSYEQTLMVFFSPDKHFDSVFTTSYIQEAAYCQALVYELLYVNVFKLPDVMYAVERMLHDPEEKKIKIVERKESNGETVEDRIITSEGREFILNTPEETECVLENYRFCHFHNNENFISIAANYRSRKNSRALSGRELILVNPMLCEQNVSCVRQLLKDGITPFPYKVAKALDPSIYRNIEFDSWSDARREMKYSNWQYDGKFLQVGSKCMVKLDDNLLYCYIQEIDSDNGLCVVYVEKLAECRSVRFDALLPLMPDRIRPWMPPCKLRKSDIQNLKLNNLLKRKSHQKVSLADNRKFLSHYSAPGKSICYALNNINNMTAINSNHLEMLVLPIVIDDKNRGVNSCDTAAEARNHLEKGHNASQPSDPANDGQRSGRCDLYATPSTPYGANQQPYYPHPEPIPYDPTNSPAFYTATYPVPFYPVSPQGSPHPYAAFYGPVNPSFYNPLMHPTSDISPMGGNVSEGVPNFQALPSVALNGSDLPLQDMATLRYFYNLGVGYFRQHQFVMQPAHVPYPAEQPGRNAYDYAEDSGAIIHELADDFEHGMTMHTAANNNNNNERPHGGAGSLKENAANKRKHNSQSKHSRKSADGKPGRGRGHSVEGDSSGVALVPSNYTIDGSVCHNMPQPSFPYGIPMMAASPPYPPAGYPYFPAEASSMDPMMSSPAPCYVPTYMVSTMMASPPGADFMPHDNLLVMPPQETNESRQAQPVFQASSQATAEQATWDYQQQSS